MSPDGLPCAGLVFLGSNAKPSRTSDHARHARHARTKLCQCWADTNARCGVSQDKFDKDKRNDAEQGCIHNHSDAAS